MTTSKPARPAAESAGGAHSPAPYPVACDGAAAAAQGSPVHDVAFDFGGVLVEWDARGALMARYSAEATERFLTDPACGFSRAVAVTDGGGTIAEAHALLDREVGAPWVDMYDYYAAHYEDTLVGTVPGALRLVSDLREAGVGVWGISNWGAQDFPVALRLFPVFSQLDGYVISGRTGLVKPHADMFSLALSRFGTDPATTLFVDDRADNVAGANGVGMRGVVFGGSMRSLRQTLVALGVAIPCGELPAGPAGLR